MNKLILALLFIIGCSGVWEETYTGPESDEMYVNIDKLITMRDDDRYGGMKITNYLVVTNPSKLPGTVDVFCDDFIVHDIAMAPRISKHFLLPNTTTKCSIYYK